MLNFLDHLLGRFTAQTTPRISAPCGNFGSSTRRKRSLISVYVEFLDHLLGGFTATTTLRIPDPWETSDRLLGGKKAELLHILDFRPFTRRLYRENDHPNFSPVRNFVSPTRRKRSQIIAYIEIFRPFTRWLYRQNDPPYFKAP